MSSDGGHPIAQGSVPPGGRFGRYEILRLIGAGGMGNVYEARHNELDKRVALKVLSRRLAKNAVYLERFLREGRVAAKLDHPHVVDVFDVGTQEGAPFLVMEFLVGTDLEGHLKDMGSLDPAAAVDILLPILSALVAAHETGLIHRDLKPANIFLAKAAHGGIHPKLLDFGIAKPNDEEGKALTGTADVFGTPQYMAPEQVRRSRDADSQSDQYSMGAVLYRALAGREAYELDDMSMFELLERVVAGSFSKPSAFNPHIPAQLEGIVLRAMALKPEDRFPSIQAFGAALLPFASASVRNTWTRVFSRADEVAETLTPSAVGHPDMIATVVPSQSADLPKVSTDAGGTMAASSHDAEASQPRPPQKSPKRIIYAGIAAGLILSASATLMLRGKPPLESMTAPAIASDADEVPAPDTRASSASPPRVGSSGSGPTGESSASPSASVAERSDTNPKAKPASTASTKPPIAAHAESASPSVAAPSATPPHTTPEPKSTRYTID